MTAKYLVGTLLLILGAVLYWVSVTADRDHDPLDQEYANVEKVVAREVFDRMKPVHRRVLAAIVENNVKKHLPPVAACWEVTPQNQEYIDAFNAAITLGADPGLDFQSGNRWSSTSGSGGGLQLGQPTVIRYSFVPDGTSIPASTGFPTGTSSLFSWLNGLYGGNPATWQAIFQQEFDRWAGLTGLSYVFEPNDDGSPMFGAVGAVGVRGDVRIGAKTLDGNSGVLAFNFFPNNGDMVLDAFDSFYSNLGNNSRRLRNVITHEHGHGIGLFHTCPSNGQKLMEPFINTGFLGPQHDDVRGGHFLYGDIYEPNQSFNLAHDLGVIGLGTTTVANASTHGSTDVDFYQFSVTGSFNAAVTVTPAGLTYQTGPQVNPCSSGGSSFNSLTVSNLDVQIVDSNGVTPIATGNSQPAGAAESISPTALNPAGGTFYVRVSRSSGSSSQLYNLQINLSPGNPAGFVLNFPNAPQTVLPEVATTLDVAVLSASASPDVNSGLLFTSIDGGAFTSSPLVHVGGDDFEGTLPGLACFSKIRYYATINDSTGNFTVFGPPGAPAVTNEITAIAANLDVAFQDNFQTNMGWTVSNTPTLTDGAWNRGVPIGGGDRGDPPVDADGSGACYLTDNVDGNSDVDGGGTTLTSPAFDLSQVPNARISYSFWYDNDFGAAPNSDTFIIEITDNGTTWVSVELYNANTDIWNAREIILTDFVSPTANVRMRFTAQDLGTGSVVEAGVDAFLIETCPPSDALGPCGAGFVGLFSGLGITDVLFVNGSAGGFARRVDLAVGQPFSIEFQDPPLESAENFIIFGRIGIPEASEAFTIPSLVGIMCFTPSLLSPANPFLFTLTNNFAPSDPQLVQSSPTPSQIDVPLGLPIAATFTLQGVMSDGIFFHTTNGVIINIE